MKRNTFIILTALALLISLVVAIAAADKETPNDPTTNSSANACYTGGSMAGKCKSDAELWKAGWYEIRFEYGLISRNQIPDQYKWLLNNSGNSASPETTPEA